MINSRRTVTEDDRQKCCAKCKHMKLNDQKRFVCKIDGLIYLDQDLISMFTCDKFKEVKK